MSTSGSYQARLKSELNKRLEAAKRPLEQKSNSARRPALP